MFVALFILMLAAFVQARSPVRVLLLQSFDEAPLTFGAVADTLRAELSRRTAETINFVQVSLQPMGFRTIPEASTVAYLRSTFLHNQDVDLVVTIGAPAALFAQRHRRDLFRDIPIEQAIVDVRFLRNVPVLANGVTVAVKNDIAAAVSNVLSVLPDTRHVFIVVGASPLGDSWRESMRSDLRQFQPPLTIEWSSDMSFPEVLKRSATLAPHSALLFVFFNVDAQGAAYNEERVSRGCMMSPTHRSLVPRARRWAAALSAVRSCRSMRWAGARRTSPPAFFAANRRRAFGQRP